MSNWNCQLCTFLNHEALVVCEVCSTTRFIDTSDYNTIVGSEEKIITLLDSPEVRSYCTQSMLTSLKPLLDSSSSLDIKNDLYVEDSSSLTKQNPSSLSHDHSIIRILENILLREKVKYSLVSPPLQHISQTGSYGASWSCGYRNIQMLCSSLLQLEMYRNVLFYKDGKLPTIPEIQNWIEQSWKAGYDIEGALQFGQRLKGRSVWIGTTECAALLRYFGLRAIVVDFRPDDATATAAAAAEDFTSSQQLGSSSKYDQFTVIEDSGNKEHSRKRQRKEKPVSSIGNRVALWLRKYFSDQKRDKFPVYSQKAGHSRTIIGVEWNETREIVENLLIFDPASKTNVIHEGLATENSKLWQKHLVCRKNSFKETAFQLLYIAPGIMTLQEQEASKVIIGVSDAEPIHSTLLPSY